MPFEKNEDKLEERCLVLGEVDPYDEGRARGLVVMGG